MAAALVVAMSSCSKDEQGTNTVNGEPAEIRLSSGIAVQTKAAYSGDVAVKDLQFLRMDAAKASDDFTGKTPIVGSRAVGGAITFEAPQFYAADGNTYFASYYPSGTLADDVLTWGIDAKTDIMTAAVIDAGSQAEHTNPGSLAYQHRLAQIEVICKAASAKAVTRWGNITAIRLKNTPTTMTLAYNGLVVAPGTVLNDMPLVKPGYSIDFETIALSENTEAAVNAVGMFTAQNTQSFQLEIVTEKEEVEKSTVVTIDLGAGKKLQPGKRHTITLTFNEEATSEQDAISVNSTIAAWNEGASGAGSLN